MKKVEFCPKCDIKNPLITLSLIDPIKYEDNDNIPDSRVYELVCLDCNQSIDTFVIDNTIIAVKELRDEMEKVYGKSTVISRW